MVCGIVPALRASRADVMEVLRSVGGRSGGLRGGRKLRSGVVVTEVALSFILLVGAGSDASQRARAGAGRSRATIRTTC